MDVRGIIDVLRSRWRWWSAALLLCVVAAAAYVVTATPTYRSAASVYFSLQYGDSASDLVQGSTYTQNQVASFAALATTPAVLQPVIDDLGLGVRPDQLALRVTAAAPLDTVLVDLAVTDIEPTRAAQTADAIAAQLARTVEQLAPRNAAGGSTIRAEIVAPAELPLTTASPDVPLAVAGGLLAGILLGLGAAFLRHSLDNRVRDERVAVGVTGLPVLGSIGRRRDRDQHPVVVEVDPVSPQAEFFRQVRTNMQFLAVGDDGDGRSSTSVLVTSATPGEGKSTVAANLAVALAESGARVLLVDADLRRPSLGQVLGLESAAGLTTVLAGRAELVDVVQPWGASGLDVVTCGVLPPNPSELLGSPAMQLFVDIARRGYDHVVVDSAPLLPVADAAVLSRLVDGVIVVADVRGVRRHQLAEAVRSLRQVDARMLGLVLNRVVRTDPAYSYERLGDLGRGGRRAAPRPVGSRT